MPFRKSGHRGRIGELHVGPLQCLQHFPQLGVRTGELRPARVPQLHSSKYTARSAGTGYCTRSSSFSAAKCCSTFVMPDVEMTLSQNTRERRREQQHRELGFLQPAASQVQVLQSA